jgi:hypothetical protein
VLYGKEETNVLFSKLMLFNFMDVPANSKDDTALVA